MMSIYGAPLSATSHIYILFYSARVKSCKKGQNCLHTKSLYNEEKAFNEISDILSRDSNEFQSFLCKDAAYMLWTGHIVCMKEAIKLPWQCSHISCYQLKSMKKIQIGSMPNIHNR